MSTAVSSITVEGKSSMVYTFAGPYTSTASLEDKSGVYAIFDRRSDGYYLLDVGESHAVKTRVEQHDRKPCWQRNMQGTLMVGVLYTPNQPQSGRRTVEQDIRACPKYRITCGVL